jgi:sensor histidine kinase regulating citrate/malate metabolism
MPKVVSNDGELNMMAGLLTNGPEKSIKQYIDTTKDRLKNVYKQTKATQKPQVSGLLFS